MNLVSHFQTFIHFLSTFIKIKKEKKRKRKNLNCPPQIAQKKSKYFENFTIEIN
jgi:hypothetical protein